MGVPIKNGERNISPPTKDQTYQVKGLRMAKVDCTKTARAELEKRFGEDFPLTVHSKGFLVKKIKGKQYRFGTVDDPDAALAKYEHDAPLIRQGLDPNDLVLQIDFDNLTVDGLVQLFLNEKLEKSQSGEDSPETYLGYKQNSLLLFKVFKRTDLVESLTPGDFKQLRAALADGVRFTTLSTRIIHIRAFFNWGSKNNFIKSPLPNLWGTQFQKPSAKSRNIEKSKSPSKIIPANVFLQLVENANINFKALLYLVLNTGIGNNDLANLKTDNIDFQNQSVDLIRIKTGVQRRAFLWDETVKAIRAAIDNRPEPIDPEDKELVFLNSKGGSYRTTVTSKGKTVPITREFTRLRKRAGLEGYPGLSFYSFRHTFQTVADNATVDFVGVRSVMGHSDSSISGNYRGGVSDERLKRISDAVRAWLFGGAK